MATSSQKTPRTRQAILNLLKQEGGMASQDLADRLGVSAMAIRQHLYGLQEQQLVTYEEEARSMGRPAKLWRLTPAANQFFPHGYAELTLGLIQSAIEVFGEAGLERLLEVRTRQQIADYQGQVSMQDSLQSKLDQLAMLRTEEGYMAEVQPVAEGSFLLIENHCPICAAATACTGLCSREQEVFQAVLGQDVSIDRTEHLVSGARRCVYQISLTG
ncbi:transcriptional regulator [filamentous cyanobacterium CCP1]|nr:transcriptional regulator [filamentous cyanobacterium CCP2]PSB56749.1 transcriptional regulator [filamentous cyanobacterium CCP1]